MKNKGLGNKEIFSKNLRKYIKINEKERSQVAKDLKVSYSTLSDWVNGNTYPRIDKIEQLARYFKINKSDLIEDHGEDYYYIDEDTKQIAQEIFDSEELKALFNASRGATKEDLKITIDLLLSLKRKENKGAD